MSLTSSNYDISQQGGSEYSPLLHNDNMTSATQPPNTNTPVTLTSTNNSSSDSSTSNSNRNWISNSTESQSQSHSHWLRPIRRGIMYNRMAVLIVLVILVSFALYTEQQISLLTVQLESEQQKVQVLEHHVQDHDQTMERFNSSVTNSDVITQLTQLETNLHDTIHNLQLQLHQTQLSVTEQLDNTIQQLNQSVATAEMEISNQVDRVKKDVEQYVITTQDQFSMENSFMVYQLAGTFTLLSCLISMWHMSAHLRKLVQPQVQRKILAILWMSPLYAVTSWFSLVFHSAEGYLAIVKDFYEAYVIYQFLSFCIAVLGRGNRSAVVDLLTQHADHLTPPFRLWDLCRLCACCRRRLPYYEDNRQLADEILLQCQVFAMQFVFLRPLTTTAMVVLGKFQYYGAGTGPTDYRSPQFYIVLIQNISIFVAFTGLLKFYHAVDKELAWCRPFAKFLCIKGVVFMTFWQGLAISILAQTTSVGGDSDEWAQSAQNFLICLEMLLFSIAHFYCFPTEEWEEGYRVKHQKGNFGDSIALGDFFEDLKLILKANGSKKKKIIDKRLHPPTILEDDENSNTTESTCPEDTEAAAERAIARALEESLGSLGDDPEIREAKKRLLESKILSPDLFTDDSYNDVDTIFDADVEANLEGVRKQLLLCNTDILSDIGISEINSDIDSNSKGGQENPSIQTDSSLSKTDAQFHNIPLSTHTQQALNEGSSLLSATNPPPPPSNPPPPPPPSVPEDSSTFMECLRPSIFTTVASIAEMERRQGKDNTGKQ